MAPSPLPPSALAGGDRGQVPTACRASAPRRFSPPHSPQVWLAQALAPPTTAASPTTSSSYLPYTETSLVLTARASPGLALRPWGITAHLQQTAPPTPPSPPLPTHHPPLLSHSRQLSPRRSRTRSPTTTHYLHFLSLPSHSVSRPWRG